MGRPKDLRVPLTGEARKRLERDAEFLGWTPEVYAQRLLEGAMLDEVDEDDAPAQPVVAVA